MLRQQFVIDFLFTCFPTWRCTKYGLWIWYGPALPQDDRLSTPDQNHAQQSLAQNPPQVALMLNKGRGLGDTSPARLIRKLRGANS